MIKNIETIPDFLKLPEYLKKDCNNFIQRILSSEFPKENVTIRSIKPYADGVEVTFLKSNEEYTFCNVTSKFFEEAI